MAFKSNNAINANNSINAINSINANPTRHRRLKRRLAETVGRVLPAALAV